MCAWPTLQQLSHMWRDKSMSQVVAQHSFRVWQFLSTYGVWTFAQTEESPENIGWIPNTTQHNSRSVWDVFQMIGWLYEFFLLWNLSNEAFRQRYDWLKKHFINKFITSRCNARSDCLKNVLHLRNISRLPCFHSLMTLEWVWVNEKVKPEPPRRSLVLPESLWVFASGQTRKAFSFIK